MLCVGSYADPNTNADSVHREMHADTTTTPDTAPASDAALILVSVIKCSPLSARLTAVWFTALHSRIRLFETI